MRVQWSLVEQCCCHRPGWAVDPGILPLGAPWASPAVLHQAVGMFMEYLDCSGPKAFEALTAFAVLARRDTVELAADVVERRFAP